MILRFLQRVFGKTDAVYLREQKRHLCPAVDVQQQVALVGIHIGIGKAVGRQREVPVFSLRGGVYVDTLLGIQGCRRCYEQRQK